MATKKQRVTLIGDLVPACNFGAVATSTLLMEMFEQEFGHAFHHVVDFRSFERETPVEGWSEPFQLPALVLDPVPPVKTKTCLTLRNMLWNIGIRRPSFLRAKSAPSPHRLTADILPARYAGFDAMAKAILEGRAFPYEKRVIEDSDIVVINGEGNIVHGVDAKGRHRYGARYILMMAYFAKVHMGKTCLMINHTVDAGNSDIDEMVCGIYPRLDLVAVREPLSIKYLENLECAGNIHCMPDVLFALQCNSSWSPPERLSRIIDFSEPYICLGDSSGLASRAGSVLWSVREVYGNMVRVLREHCKQVVLVDGFAGGHRGINAVARDLGLPQVNLRNCSFLELAEILGRAELFVSGRWHASIMAAVSGTPFVLWSSDSHKTLALQMMFECPTRFYDIHTIPVHLDHLSEDDDDILRNRQHMHEGIHTRALEYGHQARLNVSMIKGFM